MHTFGELVVVDPRTLRPVVGVAQVTDAVTGDPVATYTATGDPAPVVSSSRGYVGQFQTPDGHPQVRLTFPAGDPVVVTALDQVAKAAGMVDVVENGRLSEASLSATIGTAAVEPARAAARDYLAEDPDVAQEAAQRAGQIAADPTVAGLITSETVTGQKLDNTFARANHIDAERFKTPTRTDLQAIHAACAAATAAGPGNIVRLSARTWDVEGGLKMAGYSCGLVGVAASAEGPGATVAASGTVLHATTQSGPVLDLQGWVHPPSFVGKIEFGHLALRGNNAADPTKNNAGIRNTSSFGSTYIHDISVMHTGGPGLDIFRAYLCDFARIVVLTPVGAQVNNVPYMRFRGCNGNRFDGLGFRSLLSSGDVGTGGALVVTDDGTYQSEGNVWFGTWFEFLHVPTGGTLIHTEANDQKWRDTYFVDCSKETGATGTSLARFASSTISNHGGNEWTGSVPGNGGGATNPDTGIRVSQPRNLIFGTKGFKGANVTLEAGVSNTTVILAGARSGATDPGVVDNSGQTTNVLIDHVNRTAQHGPWLMDTLTGGGVGPRILQADNPTRGAVWLGNTGTRIQSVGVNTYVTGDSVHFRDISLATSFVMNLAFNPGMTWPNHPTSLPPAAANLRGKVVLKHGATGAADQMYVCRKKADDTYEWAPILGT